MEGSTSTPLTESLATPHKLEKRLAQVISIVAFTYGFYHLLAAKYIIFNTELHINFHIMMAIVLVFLIGIKINQKTGRFTAGSYFNIVCIAITLGSMIYIQVNYDYFKEQIGIPNVPMIWSGLCVILMVLISTKKTWGWLMPIFAVIALLYAYLGPYIPAPFYHGGLSLQRCITSVSTNFQGIYGLLTSTSANTISLFCVFAGLMESFGMLNVIMNMASVLGSKIRSGDAQVAVISSGLVGSITGSAAANVTMTGTISIPLMKRRGYSKNFAGAVEAAASTGGSILPPVMNASAFIMAAWIGVPYIRLVAVGMTPAILYYIGVGFMVYIEAAKLGIGKSLASGKKMPPLEKLFNVLFLLPVIVLIYYMARMFSAQYSLFFAIIATVVVGAIREFKKNDIKGSVIRTLKKCYHGLEGGAKSLMTLVVVLGTMGIVVQILTSTGLSSKFSQWAIGLAGSNLLILAITVAAICVVFGMGMPSAPAYVLAALLGAPALVMFGVPQINAHFFVFYFAEMSALTPPVALCALVATGMAGGKFLPTCFKAIKLAIMGFTLPFFFIWNPGLLLTGTAGQFFWALLLALGFLVSFSISFQNHWMIKLHLWERIGFFITAGLIITQIPILTYIGLPLTVILLVQHFSRYKRCQSELIGQAG